MLLYLTYNDQPSGVYWSQVTDVVEHLNTLGGPKVRLVALVSGRDFLRTRRKIKAHSPSAWVLPMVPTMKRWKANTALVAWVCRLLRPTGLICRGPFATWMALRLRERGLTRKVCFDGRGAYAAEWEEYRIIDDDALIAQFRPLEQEAVNASDMRIAVSQALVGHWRERYGYTGDAHVVIPCTLGKEVERVVVRAKERKDDTIRLVYSGSTAGWQSFDLLKPLLTQVLDAQPNARVLFLSKRDANNSALEAAYPGRVEVKWLDHAQVAAALAECDHGIMVRERTITNCVASPTKFAEYLSSGLRVITNVGLGDLSELVARHDLGAVVEAGSPLPALKQVSPAERQRLRAFALRHFTKQAYDASYRRVLQLLG
ncbi:MAG TPA: hypothetical protein PKE21_09745 [Flavobacteriales bacterium]|nr:hypothetical protein [Flavobacteriales bacterium]HMR27747.1 hypothetical protein [Flavobacteriales bacterium]